MGASNVRSLVVCRLSSLGDVILTTTVLQPLRDEYPDAHIHMVTDHRFVDVFHQHPANIQLHAYRRDMKSWELEDIRRAIAKQSNDVEPDLVIDLQNNRRSGKLLLPFKTKPRVLKKYHLKKFLDVHTSWESCRDLPHVVERYGETAAVAPANVALPADLPEADLQLPALSSGIIGLCLGAGHYTKRWPFSRFVELADALTERGYTVAMLGGLSETTDSDRLIERVKQPDRVVNACQPHSLLHSFAVISQCDHIVCNDSAIAHMAAAYAIPVTVLFGSTVPRFGFTPWNAKHNIVETNVSCRPCTHYGRNKCPKEHFRCMREITVDQVLPLVQQV